MATTERQTEWMTVEEAAKYLKVSASTLYRWRDLGRVVFHRIGPRTVRLRRDELAAMPPVPETEDEEALRRRREAWAREATAFARRLEERYGKSDDSAVFLRHARQRRERQLGER